MGGLVSPATLEQIRSANDIVEIIGGCVPLKRAGANFVALCPFHKEKTPSFNVNAHRQIFHCFGCHKGGDVFTFIKEHENIGFMDAVRRLAERARIPLEFEQQPGFQQARHLKETLLQIHEQITQRWQSALRNDAAGQVARDYLERRGVSAEAIELFRLGYAPDAWDDTVNWAKSKGYEPALVEKAGLIVRREGSDGFYDRFRGRLMFPICDEQGRVIGFSGRILTGDEKTAKYVNSPETPLFTKSKVMFGLDKSKRALLDAQCALICEGQLDYIACYMAGIRNVVAPQGTALTAEHARTLKRYVNEVILCFDSDAAGQNAAVRSVDSLLAAGLAVRVVTVPAPHDPDSFIRAEGAPAFQALIGKAQEFFDFYLSQLCQRNDVRTDKGQLAVVRGMGEFLQKTGSAVLLDTWAQKTALRLGVSADAVRVEFKKQRARPGPIAPEEEIEVEPPSRPSVQEFWLLKLVLENDDQIEWLSAHFQLDWLNHAGVRQIVEAHIQGHKAGNWPGFGAWLAGVEDPAIQSLATEALAEPSEIPEPAKRLVELSTRLRNQALDRELQSLTQQLAAPALAGDDSLKLLHRQQEVRRAKKEPLPHSSGSA